MPFEIIRNDITKVEVDAVVNAANSNLKMGSGVCGALFSAAGKENLRKECDEIGYCDEGQAVITDAYKLPSKHIIHTVGPVWKDGYSNEEKLLKAAYTNSLKLAIKNNCKSIAFPLISTGHFGYPKKEAFQVAINTISDFLDKNEIIVYLVIFDKESLEVSEKRLYAVKKYIDDNYVEEAFQKRSGYRREDRQWMEIEQKRINQIEEKSFDAAFSELTKEAFEPSLDETFSQMLLRLIDERGLTDPQAYNRAYITRKHFSKIRNDIHYQPKKKTAVALSIALLLNIDDTARLLRAAGLALSNGILSDVIIEFHIRHGIYDIFQINEMLLAFDQEPLGA
ncbi:MAG: macro domain-containing protein [Clostridiales bacterium]|nr:macro domain-containing protein [Clostridiales bacterium]